MPMAFTEQGVAMLSSVLASSRAIDVNISIMRVFVRLRKMIDSNRELADKIDKLEMNMKEKTDHYDQSIALIFETLRELMQPPDSPRIGLASSWMTRKIRPAYFTFKNFSEPVPLPFITILPKYIPAASVRRSISRVCCPATSFQLLNIPVS
jgi:hypothetical protein